MSLSPSRADRLYLGWQYVTLYPEPGPPPRRPVPPDAERLDPGWAAAQRREENLLNRPLKTASGTAVAVGAAAIAADVAGWLNALVTGICAICCLLVTAISGHAVWQGRRALRSRLDEERDRVAKVHAAQEGRLFTWQAEHASRVRQWQALCVAYEHQKRWYAVCSPSGVARVDVAGGTLAGWSAMLTTAAAHRLAAGGEVTVFDLTEGSVAVDLISFARTSGTEPLVWVLPEDLPRLELGTGLDARALADVLSLVASVGEEHGLARDLSFDNAILERVIGELGGTAAVAGVAAGLRTLAQIGNPQDDVAAGLIMAAQADRLASMFGRGAADRVVVERAWVLESQLRKLAAIGTALVPEPYSPLHVIAVGRHAGAAEGRVLGTYLAVTMTHALRAARPGRPWQHTLFLLGAERLRGDTLDRLSDACERTATGLVLGYRAIPAHVRQRLGRGNAAVAFMRLGNAEDAKTASEQIGSEHRLVLSQFTETVGRSVTDTASSTYTSTAGSAGSVTGSWSTSEGSSRSSGHSRVGRGGVTPAPGALSRSVQVSDSRSTGESASVSASISASTAWGITTSAAAGDSDSFTLAMQRSREFLVEQHELQQLPPSAMILGYAGPAGRHVVMVDVNPGIAGLSAATMMTLQEFRGASAATVGAPPVRQAADPAGSGGGRSAAGGNGSDSGAAPDATRHAVPTRTVPEHAEPVSWRSGNNRPPPNLGPPPPRLDWRDKRRP